MIGASGVIVYADGSSKAFETGPRDVIAWERYATLNGIPVTPTEDRITHFSANTWQFYHAYLGATRGQRERPAFDDWLEGVVDLTDFAYGEIPPTPKVASDGLSALSPREPESPPNHSGTLTPATSRPLSTS
jgi:hypothetical protein